MTLVILIFVVIIASAFFSGLEAALFAVSDSRAHVLDEKGAKGAKSLIAIRKKMSRPIVVIVIGNNIANIVGSIFIGFVAGEMFGSAILGVISAVLTILIIIFGEIIPKTIGENHSEKISLFLAPPLLFATKIFFPIIWILEHVTDRFVKAKDLVSEDEIRILSHLGSVEGSIEEDEKEMIHNVFTLNDLTAKDIMVPREDVEALNGEQKIGEYKEEIYNLDHSTYPVYHKTIDNILGVCHRRNLFLPLAQDKHETIISEYIREAIIVPPEMKSDVLLPLLQHKHEHTAVVQDKDGKTLGIVTMEDILEELVGEIEDDSDDRLS